MISSVRWAGCTLWARWALVGVIAALVGAAGSASAQVVPDVPPYCKAGQLGLSAQFGNGEQTEEGSYYCIPRKVSDQYAVRPEGWDQYVGYISKITAFFPSDPPSENFPILPSYPQVVLTYTGGNYANWPEHTIGHSLYGGLPGQDPTYHQIDLTRVLDCVVTDKTCIYEVRPLSSGIGDPAEWFVAHIPEEVDGNGAGLDLFPFAEIYAAVGLVGDGNHAPHVKVSANPVSDFTYDGNIFAEDPDNDIITGYVFDWGDGTVTPTQASHTSSHTYATAGAYKVSGYAVDGRGAVGVSSLDLGNLISVKAEGPHTVPVGGHVAVTVTITNLGLETISVHHNYGYATGGSPKPGVLNVTTTPDFSVTQRAKGETLVGTYGIDALKSGTVTFAFGANSYVSGCNGCPNVGTYVDYPLVIGNGGDSPTPTATPTPTPTATPDESALRKCRAALAAAAGGLAQAEAAAEAKCRGAIVAGKLPPATSCRSETKTAAAIDKAREKLGVTIAKACGGKDKTCGTGDDLSLAAIGWPIGACPNVVGGTCFASVADCNGIATCLTCIGESGLASTQALTEVFVATDPKNKAEKPLNKCQAAISRASGAFLVAAAGALEKCWKSVGDGKATGECPAADGKAEPAIAKAAAKTTATICKACGGVDKTCGQADDFAPLAIGFPPSCPDVTPPGGTSCAGPIASLQDIVTCIDCLGAFGEGCTARAAASALAAYPSVCRP